MVDQLARLQHDEQARIEKLGAQGRDPWALFLQRGVVKTISGEIRWLRERAGDLQLICETHRPLLPQVGLLATVRL